LNFFSIPSLDQIYQKVRDSRKTPSLLERGCSGNGGVLIEPQWVGNLRALSVAFNRLPPFNQCFSLLDSVFL
jgi:hypothetical protein